ncbi:MAG: Tat pathway signal protein [Clostridia bacterium]|nr:Tat pathway signal protein [Clostridia bacterium]
MGNRQLFGYLIHLGTNMWGDPDSGLKNRYAPYYPELPTSDEVWKTTVDFLPSQGINTLLIDIGDGIEYESHPEISVKGAWPKDKLKAELDRIRSLGMTPLPKLNFSCCHDIWLGEYARMISTKKYYEVVKDLITEVVELFGGPALFHLGMDEETADHQRNLRMQIIRAHDLWWHDLFYMYDICDSLGTRPWIWGDYIWRNEAAFLEQMPKSALISNWYYGSFKYNRDGSVDEPRIRAYQVLADNGYDQVPTCSTWSNWHNPLETMEFSKKFLDGGHLTGVMTAPWYMTTEGSRYNLLNDALRFGDAKKAVVPDR